jgi:uncharacterized protein
MPPHQLTGIGWRHEHERALLEGQPALPFIEVHSENFFAEGGAALALLHQARQSYDVSLHGVGRVSDHASFARAPRRAGQAPLHASDLLPIAFTTESLGLLAANVQRVQDKLARPIGVENISAYLGWADDSVAEAEFFNQLAQRTGCWLLLDVNNLVVNAWNAKAPDPVEAANAFVNAIDARHVGEIHLAGYAQTETLVIDDHGSRVHAPVWQVYAHAIARMGAKPTLVEWDTALPDFDVLLGEAREADRVARAVLT